MEYKPERIIAYKVSDLTYDSSDNERAEQPERHTRKRVDEISVRRVLEPLLGGFTRLFRFVDRLLRGLRLGGRRAVRLLGFRRRGVGAGRSRLIVCRTYELVGLIIRRNNIFVSHSPYIIYPLSIFVNRTVKINKNSR